MTAPQNKHHADDAISTPMKPRSTWLFFACFILTNTLVVFSPLSRAAIILYPASVFLLCLFVIKRSRAAFVGFISSLWLLTPFVRRVVEWRSGTTAGSAILLAPYAAIAVAAVALVPNLAVVATRRTMPLFFALGAICYGIVVGISHYSFSGLPQAVLAWAMPPIFALFLYAERAEQQSIYKAFEWVMVAGLVVIGAYGIYQFFNLPEWDAQWMIQSDLHSIGLPEPFQVRVFSTMNSPQVFAAFCAAGLLIALRSHLKIRFLAVPAGIIALVLSLSRTAWMGLAVGVVYLFCKISNKQRVRIVAVAGCSLAISLVALQVPEVNSIVTARFNSLADPQHDDSYQARAHDYDMLVQRLIDDPFGNGLSADAPANDQSSQATAVARQDSSITASLLSLGLLGAAIFALGLLLVGIGIFTGHGAAASIGARAILLSIAVEVPFNDVVSGPVGFLLWCCVGLCIAECELMSSQRLNRSPEVAQPQLPTPQAMAS